MFAKAIHVCEHTFNGVRRREPAGTTFECDPGEFEVLRKLGGATAVTSDPMDRDGDGNMGGSKKGWKRRPKAAPPTPPAPDPDEAPGHTDLMMTPEAIDAVLDADVGEGLLD